MAKVFVVWRQLQEPEGAFETRGLAERHVTDRLRESFDANFHITELDVIKESDWPLPEGEPLRQMPSPLHQE